MNAKIAIVVVFVVAAVGIVLATRSSKEPAPSSGGDVAKAAPVKPPEPAVVAPAAPAAPSREAVEISMTYSTEKKEWIEDAAARFRKEHPEIALTLQGRGSLDSAADTLDGKAKPTVWSPADSLVLRLLESDWQTKYHAALFEAEGADAAQPLVLTPAVFVMWEDRAQGG